MRSHGADRRLGGFDWMNAAVGSPRCRSVSRALGLSGSSIAPTSRALCGMRVNSWYLAIMHNHADWVGLSSCHACECRMAIPGMGLIPVCRCAGALMWIGQPAGAWSEGEPGSCAAGCARAGGLRPGTAVPAWRAVTFDAYPHTPGTAAGRLDAALSDWPLHRASTRRARSGAAFCGSRGAVTRHRN